jgi:hypothetical protein
MSKKLSTKMEEHQVNPKSWLNQYCQQRGLYRPYYQDSQFYQEGSNNNVFICHCRVGSHTEVGKGRSKAEAQRAAAQAHRNRLEGHLVQIRRHWLIDCSFFPNLLVPQQDTSHLFHSDENGTALAKLLLHVGREAPSLGSLDYWIIATDPAHAQTAAKTIIQSSQAKAAVFYSPLHQ